jgi:hypothetical protein
MVKNWGALWAAAVLVLMACAGTWVEYAAHSHCDKSGAPCQYEANQKNERLIGDVAGATTSMVAALKSNEAVITLVATAFSALSAVAVAIFTYVLARKTASLYEATAGLETAARQQVQDTKALLLATQKSADAASKSANAAEYAIKDKDVPALAVEIDPHGLVATHVSGRRVWANQSAKIWADCKIKNISGFPAVVMEVSTSAEMRADRRALSRSPLQGEIHWSLSLLRQEVRRKPWKLVTHAASSRLPKSVPPNKHGCRYKCGIATYSSHNTCRISASYSMRSELNSLQRVSGEKSRTGGSWTANSKLLNSEIVSAPSAVANTYAVSCREIATPASNCSRRLRHNSGLV